MRLVNYKTEDGIYTALHVKTGRRYAQVVVMDSSGIRIRRVPKDEERFMRELPDYPIEKAKEHFRNAVKKFNNDHVSNALTEALKPCQQETK